MARFTRPTNHKYMGEGRETLPPGGYVLKILQALDIWARDVYRDVIHEIVDQRESSLVVFANLIICLAGCVFRYACTKNHVRLPGIDILYSISHALVVYPHPVYDSLVMWQPEHSGTRISILRQRGKRTYLDERKTAPAEFVVIFPIFIKTCSQTHRMRESYAENFSGQTFGIPLVKQFHDSFAARNLANCLQHSKRQLMSRFWRETKKEWSYDAFVHSFANLANFLSLHCRIVFLLCNLGQAFCCADKKRPRKAASLDFQVRPIVVENDDPGYFLLSGGFGLI